MNNIFEKIRNLDEYLQVSYLQDFVFCKRRCSLLLLDGRENYNNNIQMTEGTIQHQYVHNSKIEKRREICKVMDMVVFSNKYSLLGKCDCVEFIKDKNGTFIDFLDDYYVICPIEYKHGSIRDELSYNIQLTAQVLCLEEMFNCYIEKGFIYYINSNKRFEVNINDLLRQKTIYSIIEIFDIIINTKMYPAKYLKKCKHCSMFDKCLPMETNIKLYMKDMRNEIK